MGEDKRIVDISNPEEFKKQDLVANKIAAHLEANPDLDIMEFSRWTQNTYGHRVTTVMKKPHATALLVFDDNSVFQIQFVDNQPAIISVGLYIEADITNRTQH